MGTRIGNEGFIAEHISTLASDEPSHLRSWSRNKTSHFFPRYLRSLRPARGRRFRGKVQQTVILSRLMFRYLGSLSARVPPLIDRLSATLTVYCTASRSSKNDLRYYTSLPKEERGFVSRAKAGLNALRIRLPFAFHINPSYRRASERAGGHSSASLGGAQSIRQDQAARSLVISDTGNFGIVIIVAGVAENGAARGLKWM